MRRRHLVPAGFHAELNLVPYLDVVTNLVMFMLLSMSGFIAFQVTNGALADEIAGLPSKVSEVSPEMSVTITRPGLEMKVGTVQLPLVPALASGEQDFGALVTATQKIKSVFPSATKVRLAASNDIRYAEVIQTMDAVRGIPSSPLFPDVAFSPAPRAQRPAE